MAFRSLQGFVVLFWVCLATTGVHASTNNGIFETTSTSPAIDVSPDSLAIKSLEIRATPTTPTSAGSTVLCGPQNGNLHCAPGLCCSGYGNCGIGDLYCQAENGCNAAFGQCGSFTSVFTPGPTGSTTLCGPANNNTICATGDCCSPAGFCGKGQTYCATPNCQYNYGTCDSDQTPSGPSTADDPRPLFGNLTWTKDIFHCSMPNVVALTFDDGPLNYTSAILDLLKKYNFRASFMVCGNNLGKGMIDVTAPYPAMLRRMIAEGHQIASHTWSHYNLDELTTAQRIEQVTKNERAIANIIGFYPTYLRPPYSGCQASTGCQKDIQTLGYHRVYFDLDTDDYLNDTPDKIQLSKNKCSAALNNLTQGQDLLSIQHDIDRQGTNLTEYYFQAIQAKGWTGVPVGECLNDDPANWYRTPGTGLAVSRDLASPITASNSTNTTGSTGTSTASISSGTTSSSSSSGKSEGQRLMTPSFIASLYVVLIGSIWHMA